MVKTQHWKPAFKAVKCHFSPCGLSLPKCFCDIDGRKNQRKASKESCQRVEHRETRAFAQCHFNPSVVGVVGPSQRPSLVVIITAAVKRSAVWLAFRVVPLTESTSWRQQPQEATTISTHFYVFLIIIIFGLEQDLCVFLPQNRFQALLNEIIQQEEREMEQVKILFSFYFV